jgi:glycosyltransferase involved in cell wall biosynthesis
MLRVFMMDLLSVVAYYDGYLCRALKSEGVSASLGAITYHFDRDCFSRLGVRNRPGFLDFVGRLKLPNLIRRTLKVIEMCLNMLALAIRFAWRPPDVIHVQYLPLLERKIPVELWLLKYCRFLGSSLVATVHDVAPHDREGGPRGQFRRAFEMMDALICHSEAARQQVLTEFCVVPERVWVIPHGPLFFDSQQNNGRAAARTRCGLEGSECAVLCQGMIRPYKGIEFLIDAWAEVQQSGARAKLIIMGRGEPDLLGSIRQQVQALGLQGSIELRFEFVPTETMISYYQAADIVVYPYKSITTSGALMTGIAQKKAIVATSLAPFRELLDDGKNALLCDYGDTRGLASALTRLISNPALRDKLANESALLSSGEQTWHEIAALTRDCYLSVTAGMKTSTARNPVAAS